MSSDICIRAAGIGKVYRIFRRPTDRLKQALWLGVRRYYRPFTALDDVSFELRRGENVAVLGRNGSGKSTLLQVVAGILKPSMGQVEVRGRVSALLELGAGFHPEFTGRENVRFLCSVLGLSAAQTEQRMGSIEGFAQIGEFVDQPVRTYSSGMFVRLAYATVAHTDPDLLIVDEALAVGDAAFQRKCIRHMADFVAKGGTLLFVSHDLVTVRGMCSRAILLDQGRVVADGSTREVCDLYERRLFGTAQPAPPTASTTNPSGQPAEDSYGDLGAFIEECWLEDLGGRRLQAFPAREPLRWTYVVRFDRDVDDPVFGMMIKTREGICVFGTDTESAEQGASFRAGDRVKVSFQLQNTLAPGTYFMNCGVRAHVNGQPIYLHRRVDSGVLRVSSSDGQRVIGVSDLQASVLVERL